MGTKEAKINKRLTHKELSLLTEGIFSNLFDIVLYTFYLPICSLGKRRSPRDVYRTFQEADELLKRVNYKKFKHSFQALRKNGFVESLTSWTLQPKITAAGKKRLESLLPEYDAERIWNGKLYLVGYDFSIENNRTRNLFREYIKRLGSIKLQESLYLNANNLYELIKEFQQEYNFKGTVLVSELSKKGFLGKHNLKSFLWEVSGLEETNLRYEKFINTYKNELLRSKASKYPSASSFARSSSKPVARYSRANNQPRKSLLQISIEYYSILKDDPQLPFKLLLDKYLGDQAYLLFKKLLQS